MTSFVVARASVLAIVAAGLTTAYCGGPKTAAARMSWTLTPTPATVGPATLTMTLRDAAGTTITGARVRIEGYMSHPGMTPTVVEAAERTPGVYLAPIVFTMPGDWVLLVSAAVTDGERVEQQIDVANVRP